MNITKNKEGSKLTVVLEGRLDTTTAPSLEEELRPELDDITELVFDFKDLAYISSAGLRVLLSTHKTMSKKDGMKIIGANEEIKEIFEVTGFMDILNIE